MRLFCSPASLSDAQLRYSLTRTSPNGLPKLTNSTTNNITYSSDLYVPPAYLEELCKRLNSEDRSNRPLRRALGFMDILNKVYFFFRNKLTVN